MRMSQLDPDSPLVVEQFFEHIWGTPDLDMKCHEWAVRQAFGLSLNETISIHKWQTDAQHNRSMVAQVKAIYDIDLDLINAVLNEEWGISGKDLLTATVPEIQHFRMCEELHTKYWDYRAAWWAEVIAHANVKANMELVRLGYIKRGRK
jgi:hypothetical protein